MAQHGLKFVHGLRAVEFQRDGLLEINQACVSKDMADGWLYEAMIERFAPT